MRFFRIFLIFLLILLVSSVKWNPQYDNTIQRTVGLVAATHTDLGEYTATFHEKFDKVKNSWYIGIPEDYGFDDSHELCVDWQVRGSGAVSTECLDFDGEDTTGQRFTFPVIGEIPSREITFTLRSSKPINPQDIVLYSTNTHPVGYRLAFELPKLTADTTVVSRALW